MTFCSCYLPAQREYFRWYFGGRAGIDFNTTPPTPLTDGQMTTLEGCATICDSAGNLLFYTDGSDIWDKTHTIMPNGTGLWGEASSSQSSIIVPQPNSDLYYVFAVDRETSPSCGCISYSVVDITANGGNGDVIQKNVQLLDPIPEKIAATRHATEKAYWIVGHKWDSDEYYAWKLDQNGLDVNNPVVSAVGVNWTGGQNSKIGYMKINPQGTKLAAAFYGSNGFIVADFDANTGVVSNTLGLNGFPYAYGCDFSPDGNLLYVTYDGQYTLNGKLGQMDVNAGPTGADIKATQVILESNARPGTVSLAPDGKVYMANLFSGALSTVHNPDVPGNGCNYADSDFNLGGKTCQQGLPNYIPFRPPPPLSSTVNGIDTKCYGDSSGTAYVTALGGEPGYSYQWLPGGQTSDSLTGLPAGTYTVITTDQAAQRDTQIVTVGEPSQIVTTPSPNDTICEGDAATVNVTATGGSPGYTYAWDGGAPQILGLKIVKPTETTTYQVTVTDTSGCTTTDSATVVVFSAKSAQITPDTILCAGGNITLNASGGSSYSWSPVTSLSNPGSANPVASPTSDITYTVTITSNYCPPITADVSIKVEPLVAQVSNDVTICVGDTAQLQASGGSIYSWVSPSGLDDANIANPQASPRVTTTYTVTVSDTGCTPDQAIVTVNVSPMPLAEAGDDETIRLGDNITLNATGGSSYQWDPSSGLSCTNCAAPRAEPDQTTTYTVIVTNAAGCQSIDSVTIVVDTVCGEVWVPTAFSPNGDGVNDVLYVRGSCVEGMTFKIFNRWGEVVFQSTDKDFGWDGTYKNGHNNDGNTAVFSYFLVAHLRNGKDEIIQGNFTLIR